MSLKHAFTDLIADDPALPTFVRPSNWNEEHVFPGSGAGEVVFVDGDGHAATSADFTFDDVAKMLEIINPTALDGSKSMIEATCTNTAAVTGSVSFGGQATNIGIDYVVYTGADVERLRIFGGFAGAYYTVESLVVQAPGAVVLPSPDFDARASVQALGTDAVGNAFYATIGTLTSSDGASGSGEKVAGFGVGNVNACAVFATEGSTVAIGLDLDGAPYATPAATLHVRQNYAGIADSLFAQSRVGISGKFQTSRTNGSNANPTVVVAGNTLQTAPLQEWRGTNGSTVVARVAIDGTFSSAGVAGITDTIDLTTATSITVVGGIITGWA